MLSFERREQDRKEMKTIVVWFEDATACPGRVAPAAAAAGMSRDWFDALTAGLSVQVRVGADHLVSSARIEVPNYLAEHVCTVLSKASLLIGTVAWVRDYADRETAEAWNRNQPLFMASV